MTSFVVMLSELEFAIILMSAMNTNLGSGNRK